MTIKMSNHAERKRSICLSHLSRWFQLVKFRLTNIPEQIFNLFNRARTLEQVLTPTLTPTHFGGRESWPLGYHRPQ